MHLVGPLPRDLETARVNREADAGLERRRRRPSLDRTRARIRRSRALLGEQAELARSRIVERQVADRLRRNTTDVGGLPCPVVDLVRSIPVVLAVPLHVRLRPAQERVGHLQNVVVGTDRVGRCQRRIGLRAPESQVGVEVFPVLDGSYLKRVALSGNEDELSDGHGLTSSSRRQV